MKARIPILGAAAAVLSIATFAAPAGAQRYYRDYQQYGRTTIRCEGDRCATWGCDRNGWHCRRISDYYSRANYLRHQGRYHRHRNYDRDHRYDRDRDYDRHY
jgi:hypothetical protein